MGDHHFDRLIAAEGDIGAGHPELHLYCMILSLMGRHRHTRDVRWHVRRQPPQICLFDLEVRLMALYPPVPLDLLQLPRHQAQARYPPLLNFEICEKRQQHSFLAISRRSKLHKLDQE